MVRMKHNGTLHWPWNKFDAFERRVNRNILLDMVWQAIADKLRLDSLDVANDSTIYAEIIRLRKTVLSNRKEHLNDNCDRDAKQRAQSAPETE